MKLKPSNLIFALFLVLMLIPSTRNFIQTGFQKVIMKVVPVNFIDKEKRIQLPTTEIRFKGITTKDFIIKSGNEKVVFINFWATWCPPCVAEMPELQKLYDGYKDKVSFAFVTSDKGDKVKAFLKKNNFNLPVYQYHTTLPNELEHTNIPTTVIINKKGEIVFHKTGVANWESARFTQKLDEVILE